MAASFAPTALHHAWSARLNSPTTSAVGRLFDAAAALAGVCTQASFEGEGPMRLEALAQDHALRPAPGAARQSPVEAPASAPVRLPLERDARGIWRSDWAPLLSMLVDHAVPAAERAAAFHASLAQALVDQAVQLRETSGLATVGLTGGVFQNRLLTEAATDLLVASGFDVRLPRLLPVNDAGLSFGQVFEFLSR
jgi:hydrogenase maturation protein HypF